MCFVLCIENNLNYLGSASPNMYRYLPRYGKAENENMQNHALNVVNFGAHLSKILKYDIP